MGEADATQLADVVARLEQLERRNERLEAENVQLRADVDAVRAPAPEPAAARPGDAGRRPADAFDRRRLLRNGAVAVGVAAAGAVLANPTGAAATNGQAIVLGTAGQTTTQSTQVVGTGSPGYAFGAIDNAIGVARKTTSSMLAHAKGTSAAYGMEIAGEGLGNGLFIHTENGTPLRLETTSNQYLIQAIGAISASRLDASKVSVGNDDDVAVVGLTASSIGISGQADTGTGVDGSSQSGTGIHGSSLSGTGLKVSSGTGTGIETSSGSDVGLRSTSTSGLAVQALTTTGQGLLVSAGAGSGADLYADLYQLRLVPASSRGAPTSDSVAHYTGEIIRDSNADLWVCVNTGAPGTFRKLGGPATAGQLHLLPTPVRAYDSRAFTTPSQGPKSPLPANTARTISLDVGSSSMPPHPTGVAVNILLVNAATGSGNFTIYANGVARPQANTLVWGGDAGRFSTFALTSVDAAVKVQLYASLKTDVVIDVVGYYG